MLQSVDHIRQFWPQAQDLGCLPNEYESWMATQKQDFIWNQRISVSQYDQLPPLKKINVIGLFLTPLKTKMDRLADEVSPRWTKAIHAHGSVAKVQFIAESQSPFTGLFKGADCGLLRLSVTGDPADRGFAPGLALKFLVDGQPSKNFSALVSLTGQGQNYNFFAHEFSNIVPVVPKFGPKAINLIFRRVTKYPTKLSLQELGQVDQHGQVENIPLYPEQIFLVPNPALQFPASPPHDFRADLATIASGTPLFSVYAIAPAATSGEAIAQREDRQQAQSIGSIITTSEFIASFYGDSQLFFRHQRFQNQ